MEVSPRLKKSLKKFSVHAMMHVWYGHYKLLFFLLFLATFGLSGYEWYKSLHSYQWTEEKKQDYLTGYFKETSFKEKEFQKLIARLRAEETRHQTEAGIQRDIFTGQPAQ